jgi:hypothetical protein
VTSCLGIWHTPRSALYPCTCAVVARRAAPHCSRYRLRDNTPPDAATAVALDAIDFEEPDPEKRADLMANAMLAPLLGEWSLGLPTNQGGGGEGHRRHERVNDAWVHGTGCHVTARRWMDARQAMSAARDPREHAHAPRACMSGMCRWAPAVL